MLNKLKIFLMISLISSLGFSQTTQTIRGRIVDLDSESPLLGATVKVIDSDPILGSVTDLDGNYRIENVPIGRVNLQVSFVGYEERTIPNVLVTSAKEAIVNLPLKESVVGLEEIVVVAKDNNGEVLNEMVLTSARTFSVEETQRYSGALNDPARMVASFAGVTGNAEGNNDIVVRGNSPKGIQWRLEGIEIPNPNHFANEGATGGPINALNSFMLDDSDFMSGAFAPEYGNALSGVFDMKYKKGNNQRREYTASANMLGLDFTAEGPFNKQYNGSYIANYRYSSLQLLSDIGIFDFGGIPKYQDISFNVFLPAGKDHFISTFGLGGVSSIDVDDELDDGTPTFRGRNSAHLGIFGVSDTYFINKNTFIRNTISYSNYGSKLDANLPDGDGSFYNYENVDIQKSDIRLSSTYNLKINARHKVESGVILSSLNFNARANELNFELDVMENVLHDNDGTNTFQAYTSWKYRINEDLTFINGVHYLHFGLNGSSSLEPRFSMEWNFTERQAITAGFGIHSRIENVTTYLAKQTWQDGSTKTPNKDLKPTKAAHFVLGYQYMLNPYTQFKVEAYYQRLYDVPVEETTYFSLLNNYEGYVNRSLTNSGTGRNYGVELTLERYLNNGFYYLSTLSLYQSFYKAADGVERKTAFNGNYVANFLAGKEFQIGAPEKNKVFFVNTKMALIGGARYTPIDLQASRELGTEVRFEDRPFSMKGEDIFTLNLSAGIRKNKKKTTQEFKIDISNVTGNEGLVNQYYIEATGEIEESYQLPFLPNIIYSIKF